MTTQNNYEEISPEQSFAFSFIVLIFLIMLTATLFIPLYLSSPTSYKVVVVILSIANIYWVISGYFKRAEIKPSELGAVQILGKPRWPYVFTSGKPWLWPGIVSFKASTVGEENEKVEVTEICRPVISKKGENIASAPVRMRLKIKVRFEIFDIFKELTLSSGSGRQQLTDLIDSAAREIIVQKTDFELMDMRSSKGENIMQLIWTAIAQQEPDPTNTVKIDFDKKPLEPIPISSWGIKVTGIFITEIRPEDDEVVKAYEGVRKEQLKAEGEKAQTENLKENALSLKVALPGLTDKDAVTHAQIEDNKPGVMKIIWEESGTSDSGKAGDFTKSVVTKHFLDKKDGGDKKKDKKDDKKDK